MTRHPARPRRRATVVAGVVAALALGAGAVLVTDRSNDDVAGPTEDPAATAGPAGPAGPAGSAAPASTPEPVPTGERRIRRPVSLDDTARFGTGLELRVTDLEPVRGVARGPGEIAGPAVRLTVQLTNHGERRISLESVVLSVSYGRAQTPAMTLTGPGGQPFGGTLGPGRSQRARYVFAIPVSARDRVRVVASYTGSAPSVELAGSVS